MASYRVCLPDLIGHSEGGKNGWIKPGEFLLRAKQYLLRVFIENQAIFIESQGPAVILKVWSPDRWHRHHLGTGQKGKFSGPNLRTCGGWNTAICVLTGPPKSH